VSKSVGGAVDRHRVSRRLRHVVREIAGELTPGDRMVVRALPGSRDAASVQLRQQVEAGLRRAHRLMERER
jgi:ribonuclease P protein component